MKKVVKMFFVSALLFVMASGFKTFKNKLKLKERTL